MSGLMRRLIRRRAADPHGTDSPAAAASGPDGAPPSAPPEPGGEPSLLSDPATNDQPTEKLPAAAGPATPARVEPVTGEPKPASDLPAGLDPADLERRLDSSARRGRVRRRIEFLRAAREVLLRDLGGFVFELHRTAPGAEREGHRRLRETKLARLAAVTSELLELERGIGDRRRNVVVREPGVGGECPRCGELFGSDSNYCGHCGEPLNERAYKARAAADRELERPAHGAPSQNTGDAPPSRAEQAAKPTGGADSPAAPEPDRKPTAGDDAPAAAPEPDRKPTAGDDAHTAAPEPDPKPTTPAGREATGEADAAEADRQPAPPPSPAERRGNDGNGRAAPRDARAVGDDSYVTPVERRR